MKTIVNTQTNLIAIFDNSFGFNEAAITVKAFNVAIMALSNLIMKRENDIATYDTKNQIVPLEVMKQQLEAMKTERRYMDAVVRKLKMNPPDLIISDEYKATDMTSFRTML